MPNENHNLKKIDYQADMLMGTLFFTAQCALNNVCTYMQNTTPYGEEYERAFQLFNSLSSELEVIADALQSCVEARKAKEAK